MFGYSVVRYWVVAIVLLFAIGPVRGLAQDRLALDDAPLNQAEEALDRKQWTDAERMLRGYLADHPSSAKALYLLAFTLFRENRPSESLTAYTNAAKLREPGATDLRWVALDYVLLGDYTDAYTWMSRAVELDAKDGESWYGLGRIQYTLNRFTDAIASFKHALLLMPQSVKAENNLGLAYEGLNRPEAAAAAYRQAIAWQREKPGPSEQPLLNLGTLLLDQTKPDEAAPLLKEAEELSPRDPKIHAALGKLYRMKNDLAAAQSEFEQAVALDPDSVGLHFQLGQIYRKEGFGTKAAAEFETVSRLGGNPSSEQR